MFNILKLIIIYIGCSCLYRSSKQYKYNSQKQNNLYNISHKSTKCMHSFKYEKILKDPTEEVDGTKIYYCKYCHIKYYEAIPRLNKENYKIENLTSNCDHGNGVRYFSELNGKYDLTDNKTKLHSIYGKKCKECNQLIGEFDFKNLGELKCTGYPRLIQLSDYWNNIWLLGGNFGNNVGCRISSDKGLTWGDIIYISDCPNYICSNIDLFELPNHDILSSYRAIGRKDISDKNIKYNRRLGSSISHDGALTWNNLGNIIDNFELSRKLGYTKIKAYKAVMDEERIGFFEPFVMEVNGEISVFYADDFTPMVNHTINDDPYYNYMVQNIYTQTYDIKNQKWSEERTLIMDGSILKSPTGSGLIKRISRDGMPVATTMKDGTYVLSLYYINDIKKN